MRIRALALLSVPPLFLVGALALALMSARAVREEMRWGFEQQAIGAVVTLAEFLGDPATRPDAPTDVLERIVSFGQIAEVAVTGQGSGDPLRAGGDTAAWAPLFADGVPDEARPALADGGVWVGPWQETPEGPVVRAFAPVPAGAGVEGAVVGAVLRVDALRAPFETAVRRFAWATAWALVLGLLAAAYLTRRIVSGLSALERQARAVALARDHPPPYAGGIREFSDLSATFETMRSILEDSVAKSRRALVARPASPAAMGQVLARGRPGVDGWSHAGREVAVRAVGAPDPGHVVVAARTARGGVVAVGRAAGQDALDRAREAGAAGLYLDAALAGADDPDQVLAGVRDRFRLDVLRWHAWASPAPESPASEVLHTLPPDADAAVGALRSLHAESPLHRLADRLAGSLGPSQSGVLVVVGPSSSHEAPFTETP